jgi:hypothetical protein
VLAAGWGDVVAAGRSVLTGRGGEQTSHRFMLENFIRHIGSFGGQNG